MALRKRLPSEVVAPAGQYFSAYPSGIAGSRRLGWPQSTHRAHNPAAPACHRAHNISGQVCSHAYRALGFAVIHRSLWIWSCQGAKRALIKRLRPYCKAHDDEVVSREACRATFVNFRAPDAITPRVQCIQRFIGRSALLHAATSESATDNELATSAGFILLKLLALGVCALSPTNKLGKGETR